MFEQGTINQNSEVYVRVRYRHKQCFCLVFFRHHGSYSNLHADRGSKITYFMTLSLRGRELQNCRPLRTSSRGGIDVCPRRKKEFDAFDSVEM